MMKILKIRHYHVIFRFEYVDVLEMNLSMLNNLDKSICNNYIIYNIFEIFLIIKRKYITHFS